MARPQDTVIAYPALGPGGETLPFDAKYKPICAPQARSARP